MTLAQHLTPRVDFQALGRTWRLLFTHAALLDLEALTGLDVCAGEIDLDRPPAKVLRAALLVSLRAAGAELTEAQAGKLLDLPKLGSVRATVAKAWQASMPDPEPSDDSEEAVEEKVRPKLGWMNAWAIADQVLHLSTDAWLAMTPRMYHALSAQHLEELRHQELLFGMVIANNANFSFSPPRRALKAEDFMLHPWPREDRAVTGVDVMRALARFPKSQA